MPLGVCFWLFWFFGFFFRTHFTKLSSFRRASMYKTSWWGWFRKPWVTLPRHKFQLNSTNVQIPRLLSWSPRSLPCLQFWIRPELLGSDFPLSAPLEVIYQHSKLHICSEEQKLHLSDKITVLQVNIRQNTRKG